MKKYIHPVYDYVSIVEVGKHEIHSCDFAACREPRETLGSFYNRQKIKPNVLVNAGFFALSNGSPVFNTIDEHVVRSNNSNYKVGMGIDKNTGELKFGHLDDQNWKDFLSGYPVLLAGEGPISVFATGSEINYSATRSVLGMNDETIFVLHIGRPGMRFEDMSRMLYEMGVKYAINLDGGGSARLLVNGSVFGTPTENRSVDNVFCIYLKVFLDIDIDYTIKSDIPYYLYTVKYGDSWWKIAEKEMGNGSRYQELMTFNEVKNTPLYPGMQIKIPSEVKLYTVNAGDSWWGIASKEMGSGASYKKLIEFNQEEYVAGLKPGQVLKIPV